MPSPATFTDRLRTLFWVAATNFVVPVLFSLAQIIVVYREVDVLVVNDIVLVNTSIAVIGVIFATVWVDTGHWVRDHSRSTLGGAEPSRIVFERNTHQSTESASGTSVVGRGGVADGEYSAPKPEVKQFA